MWQREEHKTRMKETAGRGDKVIESKTLKERGKC